MSDMQDAVGELLIESHENLDCLDSELIQLAEEPTQGGLPDSTLRTIHTVKATCRLPVHANLEQGHAA